MIESFKVIVPAELSKAKDGSYKVRGLATTEKFDSQGELLLQQGIDLSPIDQKRGILNWDHGKGPENVVGILDGYSHTPQGLRIEGTLFKKHAKAIAIKEIMESLGDTDKSRMGLSVEGSIVKRNDLNSKIIEKCVISAVALTMNPVNVDTQVELVKSLSSKNTEFESDSTSVDTFTTEQVVTLLTKALGVGSGGVEAPDTRTGGDALALESLAVKMKKKKLKKAGEFLEAGLQKVLDNLVILYPYSTEEDLWGALKERLNKRFPSLEQA